MTLFGGMNEATLRLTAFLSILVVMAVLEVIWPRRALSAPKIKRWGTNLSIVAIDTLTVRAMAALPFVTGAVVMPLVAIAAAVYAERNGIGLFNVIGLPAWLELVLALVVLDFAIWLQHLASHKVPLLWRLHRMHHADPDIDVTTALRFHPIEIALSMLWKMLWVFALGPSVLAVVLFEVILNGCALFNHANFKLPLWLDRVLRLFLVTPDMHRVHHSIEAGEHHRNFGFNLSIWDRMFSTYVAQPAAGHEGMVIGLAQFPAPGPVQLAYSLLIPFRDGTTVAGSPKS
ncbi:MAG: hypothetical protein RLZ98_74 [Pseudomonadota bacterium]|jgi:sterol desaturase/sphingolipid hydroxylase (fatty acid hydroxylase superfamily)